MPELMEALEVYEEQRGLYLSFQAYMPAIVEFIQGYSIFPPYSFGDGGQFYFANPTGNQVLTNQVQIYDPGLGWNICDSHPLFTSATVMNETAGSVSPTALSRAAGQSSLVSTFPTPRLTHHYGVLTMLSRRIFRLC